MTTDGNGTQATGDELIGPGSPLYRMLGDLAMGPYGMMPVLVNAVLVPKGARGVQQHDRLFNGQIPDVGLDHFLIRMWDTMDLAGGIIFAGPEAEDCAHAMHELHRHVQGEMPDGTRYHAWNQQTWTAVWAVIVKGLMDLYGELRRYRSEDDRGQVYLGFVEMGRRFRVTQMPDSLEAFDAYFHELMTTTLIGTEQSEFVMDQMSENVLKPSFARWIPTPLGQLMTLPVRRMIRVGALMSFPEELDERLGLRRTAVDKLELRAHKAVWRLVPVSLSQQAGPVYFALRRRIGNPVWQTRYSAEGLAARRRNHEAEQAAARTAA